MCEILAQGNAIITAQDLKKSTACTQWNSNFLKECICERRLTCKSSQGHRSPHCPKPGRAFLGERTHAKPGKGRSSPRPMVAPPPPPPPPSRAIIDMILTCELRNWFSCRRHSGGEYCRPARKKYRFVTADELLIVPNWAMWRGLRAKNHAVIGTESRMKSGWK